MNDKDIIKRLDAMAEAMVEAGVVTPEATMLLQSGGEASVHLGAKYDTKPFDGKYFEVISGEGVVDALGKADAYIAALPDPDAKAKQAWQGKLGEVIDDGHALNLPDDVMGPLRQGSQAMAENLLAAPESK